jgi:hypothetical protein
MYRYFIKLHNVLKLNWLIFYIITISRTLTLDLDNIKVDNGMH